MYTGNHQPLRRGRGYGSQVQQTNQDGRTQENPNRNAQHPSADRISDLTAQQVAQLLSQSGGADRSGGLTVQQAAHLFSQSGSADRSGGLTAQQVAQLFSQSGGADRSGGLATQQIAHIVGQPGSAGRTGDLSTPQAARLVNNDHGMNVMSSMQRPTEDDLLVRIDQLDAKVERLATESQHQDRIVQHLERLIITLFDEKDRYQNGIEALKNKINQLVEVYPTGVGEQDTVDPSALTFPMSGS